MTPRVLRVLKRDGMGRVDLLEEGGELRIRRVACGGRWIGSGAVARMLMRRERRALAALAGLPGVPGLEPDERWRDAPDERGRSPDRGQLLVRDFAPGRALHEAEELPVDFFERLGELVERVHARGVCHNDLHKEQNIVVGEDGWPALLDFQLASVHARTGRSFRIRCGDDLRHVAKHRRRYTRDGRGPALADPDTDVAEAVRVPRRSLLAGSWRRVVKPVYNLVTRTLDLGDGEPRRMSSGPWPRWTDPLGARRGDG